ncbi:hypothetical protein BY458DRAFT_513362 [Sporodiniella umbellata]|nr:hypothetical protein BY458DRAFT_513362 [Sporodiniella umbellata]
MSWEQFPILLTFDYLMRFILCFMFAWPPPSFLINALTNRLSSQSVSEDIYSRESNSNTKSSSKTTTVSNKKHSYTILEKPSLCSTAENSFKSTQIQQI